MKEIKCPNCGEWIEAEQVMEFDAYHGETTVSVDWTGQCEECETEVQWTEVYTFHHAGDVVWQTDDDEDDEDNE